MISIQSNGSRWNGEAAGSIEELIKVLATEPLDATFEDYGNFIMPAHGNTGKSTGKKDANGNPIIESSGPLYPDAPEALRFWGNFFIISHVFSIDTDEPELINLLTTAIRDNQATPAYLAQKNH